MTPDAPQTRMTDAWLKEYRGLAEDALRLGWRIQLSGRELTALLDAYEARTRSVEPPREMVERVRQAIVDTPVPESHREAEGDKFGASLWDTEIDALAESLAALLTLVRSQAIEMCAGVADAVGDDPSRSSHAQDAGDEIAASIRSLR